MGTSLRVSIVALDPVLEAGVTSALRDCPDAVVLTPHQAAEVTVVIVDIVAPEVLEVVRAVSGASHRPGVVLIAAGIMPAEALHAIAAGARGLLLRREATAAGLMRAVLGAASGDCIVPPGMLDPLLAHAVGRPPAITAQDGRTGHDLGLSDRERAVLSMIAAGHDTAEIASELCYSSRTVTGVVHDITRRFQLRNRAHAVAYALRAGLL